MLGGGGIYGNFIEERKKIAPHHGHYTLYVTMETGFMVGKLFSVKHYDYVTTVTTIYQYIFSIYLLIIQKYTIVRRIVYN